MSSLTVPSPPLGPTSVIAGLILCALVARFITRKRSKLSLPPGPPADPLIGHVRTFPPPERRAEVFHEWSKIYGECSCHVHCRHRTEAVLARSKLGEVFSLQVPGKTIVVLNSEKSASDLLEKRSAIYSDRPRFSFYDAWVLCSSYRHTSYSAILIRLAASVGATLLYHLCSIRAIP